MDKSWCTFEVGYLAILQHKENGGIMKDHKVYEGMEFTLLEKNDFMCVGRYRVISLKDDPLLTCRLLNKNGNVRKNAADHYLWKISMLDNLRVKL